MEWDKGGDANLAAGFPWPVTLSCMMPYCQNQGWGEQLKYQWYDTDIET